MGNRNKYEKQLDQYLIDPILDAAAEERPQLELENNAHYKARLKKQIHHAFGDFKKRFQAGIVLLQQHKKWPHDDRLKKAAKLLHHHEKWEEEVNHGKTLQEIIQLTDQELADFYKEGWNSYQHHSYEEASHIFLLLTQLNPKVGAFWSALGAAEEKRGELEGAMQAYILASELETQTLAPYIHGAKCLLLLNKVEEAKKVLHRAIERAEENHQLKEHKHTAEQMLKAIK
jgi:type III secretion system low calcium response chaperone LcrH/SycD